MIEQNILNLVSQFTDYWNDIFKNVPRYKLDFTIPSVGVLDLLLSDIREKKDLNEFDIMNLNAAAGYIGMIAYECWSDFPDQPTVEVFMEPNTDFGVTIKATGGIHARAKKKFQINISKALHKVLENPLRPFPFFFGAMKDPINDQNLLSPLASGIISSFSPWGEGHLKELSLNELKPRMLVADNFFAVSTARFYERLYPSEPVGCSPQLFRGSIAFPPSSYNEFSFASRSATNLAARLKNLCQSEEQMFQIALNLCNFPDDTIAYAAFSVCVALSTEVKKEFLPHVVSFLPSKAFLRPAIIFARKTFGKLGNWLALTKDPEEARQHSQDILFLIELEQNLELLPLLVLPPQRVFEEQLYPFFNAIVWHQAPPALKELEKIISATEHIAPDILLQSALLEIAAGDIQKAKNSIAAFEGLQLPDHEKLLFLALKATIFEAEDKHPEAYNTYSQAEKLETRIVQKTRLLQKCLALAPSDNEQTLLELTSKLHSLFPATLESIALLPDYGEQTPQEQISHHMLSLALLTPYERRNFNLILETVRQ